ncbi:hypothetical protein EB809_13885 [Marinobacter sp. R17]|uniref:hypothetical protein n=1 Tax=Marinobacter sp. R17 TaxID=2484250 RepID=UPI000F4B9DA5|nr:hypothetical protein [Marinobacter sp. R17]ROT98386.1 hypothetical protein EB809_13885 [Marinobacter sp. R17]
MRLTLNSILRKWNEEGFWGFFVALIVRIPGIKAFNIYQVYALDLTDYPLSETNFDKNVKLVRDIEHLNKQAWFSDRLDIFKSRLSLNHRGIIYSESGMEVAYLWLDLSGKHREQRYGYSIPLKSDEAFYYDSFVIPARRGKGILRKLIWNAGIFAKNDLSRSKMLATIDIQNKISRRAHKNIGFKRMRTGVYVALKNRWEYKFITKGYR